MFGPPPSKKGMCNSDRLAESESNLEEQLFDRPRFATKNKRALK